ncbi:shk1 kinase-binding protein 1 [Coprinellus micaceus]|uniref:Shk1 kinase-binding protein 1 n=1 Tax=Coprinellus micaceus TaxID=71717 RepID=A0A4Y7TKG5_COPMI|nr:shk1 kinase-binding protein 1 [Coprinellus micaceus]
MSSRWATLATSLTAEDIADAILSQDSQFDSPVLQVVSEAHAKGYETLSLPLTNENWRKRWSDMCLLSVDATDSEKEEASKKAEAWRSRPVFMRDEVTISRLDEAEGIIAMVSEWLELDSPDDGIRHDAEIALRQELAYASYLNIQAAILPPPRNRDYVASYARIINSCLNSTPYITLSVRLPIYNPSVFQPTSPESAFSSPNRKTNRSSPATPALVVSESSPDRPHNSETSLNATWEMWDLIRSMCDYNTRLTLTLDLSPALPSTLGVLSKWAAESVRYIFLPASTFIANMKGYPHRPIILLADANTGRHRRGGESGYSQYVRHLEKTSPPVLAAQKPGTVENFAQGYQDYLQAPLQPLMDNLPSATYHTFEQDPIKYSQYEEAMLRAFHDKPAGQEIVVCIAGAGRGPLVARCLKALERAHREATVFAIEKNPNAYVTLQYRQANEWGTKVQLIFGDMRAIEVPEKADILVSELLGSFGDNELSPECLDGAMRFLKPNGISIPSSYTAHLAPLSSSKLYNEARSSKNDKSLETPYVVMFQNVNVLSGTKASADGIPLTNTHNTRSAKLRFYIPHAGVLHGLAGYFEAVLYGNIGLSIHPQRKDQISKDMLSWFPLFFPFKEPLYLPSGSELQVSIWRLTTEKQVWYEWHAESFLSVPQTNSSNEDLLLSPYGVHAPLFPGGAPPSPMADREDPFLLDSQPRRSATLPTSATPGALAKELEFELVKIGHTSLHNPGGRSSWIGL